MSQNPYEPQNVQPGGQIVNGQQMMFTQNSVEHLQGQQHAQTSMILGILSLFVVGIILGPIAISKANKAEKLHVAATVGKVTGWIGTIFGIIGIVWIIILLAGVGAAVNSSM